MLLQFPLFCYCTVICDAAITFIAVLAVQWFRLLEVSSGVVEVLIVGDREGVVKIDRCHLYGICFVVRDE
jgi:hypothetical protein